jgi:hypothetical protein
MVVSLPWIRRKNGAAGQRIRLVATIAPVVAPWWPPPFAFFVALRRLLLPSARRTLSIFISSLPPCASAEATVMAVLRIRHKVLFLGRRGK